ncbi:transposase family protein, partial [Streptomyces sp900116325]|uniref:transposase family protein n=1 Tax=Streptomyces sp. 900116325 TaxID=3154295 RepID=UPI00340D8922
PRGVDREVHAAGEYAPDPVEASEGRIVLVDGTLVTTWAWAGHGTSLWLGNHRNTGFNLQVAATSAGNLIAVSGPLPGSWHDVQAWNASGFPKAFGDRENIGDLGHLGADMLTGRRKPPRQDRPESDKIFKVDHPASVQPSNARSHT